MRTKIRVFFFKFVILKIWKKISKILKISRIYTKKEKKSPNVTFFLITKIGKKRKETLLVPPWKFVDVKDDGQNV
jgi:hypothetical protein